jgi:hypothetical protein
VTIGFYAEDSMDINTECCWVTKSRNSGGNLGLNDHPWSGISTGKKSMRSFKKIKFLKSLKGIINNTGLRLMRVSQRTFVLNGCCVSIHLE